MIPLQIDRYQILEECGRGGMAIVYKAYDPQRQEEVALKVLPREYLHDPQFRTRFKREIDINISFRHEAVVPILGYGQVQGQLYLVMRYMTGGSLETRLKTRQKVSLEEMIRVLNRIAPGLDAAHQNKIIHRDMKPSNILFDAQGQAYIADFGIARLQEAASFTMLTGNAVIGSPAYMSPEQARSGTGVDGRSDLYSMGIMLFEALTGDLPYTDTQPLQIAIKQIESPIPDVLNHNPKLPHACRDFFLKALAKQPEARFQTAGEMAFAFENAARGGVLQWAPHKSPAPVMSPSVSPPPQRPVHPISPKPTPPQASPPQGGPAQAGSPSPRPIQPASSPAPPPNKPAIPSLGTPRSLPAEVRPLSKYMQMPSILRAPALPYITVPHSLRRITGFFGMPSTIYLPKSAMGWLIPVFIGGFMLVIILGGCAGLLYLAWRFGLPLLTS